MQACIDIWRYKSGLINNFPEKKVHIWKRGSVFKLRKQLKRASFAAVLNIIRQKHKKKCSRQPMPPTLYVLWFYLPSFVQKMSHGDPNTLLFIRINGLLYSLNSMITILKPFTSVWKIDLDQLQFGFPIPHLFYFLGVLSIWVSNSPSVLLPWGFGKVRNHFFLFFVVLCVIFFLGFTAVFIYQRKYK